MVKKWDMVVNVGMFNIVFVPRCIRQVALVVYMK